MPTKYLSNFFYGKVNFNISTLFIIRVRINKRYFYTKLNFSSQKRIVFPNKMLIFAQP